MINQDGKMIQVYIMSFPLLVQTIIIHTKGSPQTPPQLSCRTVLMALVLNKPESFKKGVRFSANMLQQCNEP